MTSDIFLGSSTNKIPQGVWFLIHWNSTYYTDPDLLDTYEDVPGLAVQRIQGKIRTLIYGTLSDSSKEHVSGNIEFYNTVATSQENDPSANNTLEKGFDSTGIGGYDANNDEVWLEASTSAFWLTVTTADDSFYSLYGDVLVCEDLEPVCGNGIVEAGEECDGGASCTEQCQAVVTTSGRGAFYVPSLTILDQTVSVVILGDTSVMITWETDLPGTSQVIYATESEAHTFDSNDNLGTPPTYGYAHTTPEYDLSPKVAEHSVIVAGLIPGEVYYFRVISRASPAANSGEFSFTLALGGQEQAGETSTSSEESSVGGQTATSSEDELAAVVGDQPVVVVEPTCPYLLGYLKMGENNNPEEVIKLQSFLKGTFGFSELVVTGIFDQSTLEAVMDFQSAYQNDVLSPWGTSQPTGYVYITTSKKINEIVCEKVIELTNEQLAEIAGVKKAIEELPVLPEIPEINEQMENLGPIGVNVPLAPQPSEPTDDPVNELVQSPLPVDDSSAGDDLVADISGSSGTTSQGVTVISGVENLLSKFILMFD